MKLTRETRLALVPELRLELATVDSPLWRASPDEAAGLGAPMPYWAFAWAGGQVLARWLLDHPEAVRGKRVLDFGCGCGIVAIAAACAGAGQVDAADIDPLALEATARNATLNGVALRVISDDLVGVDRDWDLVLAGDMFFSAEVADRTSRWLRTLRAEVLVGDPDRGFLGPELQCVWTTQAASDVDFDGTALRPAAIYRLVRS